MYVGFLISLGQNKKSSPWFVRNYVKIIISFKRRFFSDYLASGLFFLRYLIKFGKKIKSKIYKLIAELLIRVSISPKFKSERSRHWRGLLLFCSEGVCDT